jgi:hypothetical protein
MPFVLKKLKWFRFSQNNSGGSFVVNENVCEEVFIQATSAREAISKAEEFCDNSDSCSCCGDRWGLWVDDSDGHDLPTVYGKTIYEEAPSMFREEARLHYYDGRVESYKFGSGAPLHALGG